MLRRVALAGADDAKRRLAAAAPRRQRRAAGGGGAAAPGLSPRARALCAMLGREPSDDGATAAALSEVASLLVPLRDERLDERVLKAAPPPTTAAFWYELGAPWQLVLVERGIRAWFPSPWTSAAVFDAVAAGDVGAQSPAAYGARDARAPRRRRARASGAPAPRARRGDGGDAAAPPARRGRVGAVALAGESAGACIAASVAERSPSRIVMSFDPLLPINALVAASQAYGSLDMDESMISYYSDAAILGEFPKTLIICGGTDPLLDDAVDFHTRLRRAGVDAGARG
ncbi:hormone-sensitive lipase [Aureococcus anophagefferens]|nr:hormone-sensitive lipase [Aureococcus anophagefferens]